jgi:hypothetical protein
MNEARGPKNRVLTPLRPGKRELTWRSPTKEALPRKYVRRREATDTRYAASRWTLLLHEFGVHRIELWLAAETIGAIAKAAGRMIASRSERRKLCFNLLYTNICTPCLHTVMCFRSTRNMENENQSAVLTETTHTHTHTHTNTR